MDEIFEKYYDEMLEFMAYESLEEIMEEQFTFLRILLSCALTGMDLEKDGSVTARYIYENERTATFQRIRTYLNRRSEETDSEYLDDITPDRLSVLTERLGLSEFGRFLVLLSYGVETDRQTAKMYEELEGSRRPGLDRRLAVFLYQLSGGELLGEDLAELNEEQSVIQMVFHSGAEGRLCIRSSVLTFLMMGKQEKFHLICPETKPDALWIYEKKKETAVNIVRQLLYKRTGVFYLNGRRGCGKRFLLSHVAWELGIQFLTADIGYFMEETKNRFDDFLLECKLLKAVPCITGIYDQKKGMDDPRDEKQRKSQDEKKLLELIRQKECVWILTGAGNEGSLSSAFSRFVSLELPEPTSSEKAVLWEKLLVGYEQDGSVDSVLNGNKYVLNAGELKDMLETAYLEAAGAGRQTIKQSDVEAALKVHSRGALGSLATLVPSVFHWEDLIVSEEVKRSLFHICNQVKYRNVVGDQWGFYKKMPYGRGVSALLFGPPGTGKTMAVQVIAGELGMDLYRVDMSQMVSKYIGETEKNITALFERASHMNAILFFDEADAFFSQRSEVKDSHDRNANAEVAHLLQKMEEYAGITILATNMKEHIDDAFKRRIRFMVDFRFPDVETRRGLWKTLLPEAAPVEEELDLDFFAEQFELSGSQIKEVLQNAAFIAAAEESSIGNSQVKEALKMNYAKYGKTLTKEDFGYLG